MFLVSRILTKILDSLSGYATNHRARPRVERHQFDRMPPPVLQLLAAQPQPPTGMSPRVVAVTGVSRSGKGVLAAALAAELSQQLGMPAEVICQDNFAKKER
eukprot:SAG31_NODE_4656_length_3065_cov_13.806136_3_plen_102_part_00